jgi:predicted enzyme related to lactoylglutathione lyase
MRYLLLPVLALVLLVSCGKETYPPILSTPTYTYQYGDFVWHELGCTDMSATKDFYNGLFGWGFEDYDITSLNYSLITYNGQNIGGIVESTAGGMNQWIGAISVKKPKSLMGAAVDNGAMELVKSTTLPGRGTMGLMKDPQGATFALINSFNGDPEQREADINEWMWMELWTGNTQSSSVFYEQFYQFSSEESTVDSKPYWTFKYNDKSVAGMIENPVENMDAQWVPYVRVDDPAAMASKAASLGGKVLMEPRQDVRNGSVAVLMDPGGAIFCVQKWPIN